MNENSSKFKWDLGRIVEKKSFNIQENDQVWSLNLREIWEIRLCDEKLPATPVYINSWRTSSKAEGHEG